MVLPLLLTLTIGILFQIADLANQGKKYGWLIAAHKGNFGTLHLEAVYPFLNGLGLLILAVTGISIWWQIRAAKARLAKKQEV